MKKGLIVGLIAIIIVLVGIGIYRSTINPNKSGKPGEIIQIAAIVPLSGSASNIGIYSSNGLKMAVEDFNQKSAENAIKIQLIIEDSRSDAKGGIAALNKILLTNNPILVYSQMSSVSMSLKDILVNKNIPLIAISSASGLLKNSNSVFRNYFDPDVTAKTIASFLIDSLNSRKVAIFFSNDDYGQSIRNSFSAYFQLRKQSIEYESSFELKNENFRDIVNKGNVKYLDNIFLVGVGKGLGNLMKQIRQAGFKGNFIGDAALTFPDIIATAGSAYTNVWYYDYDFDEKSILDFNARYKDKYPNDNYAAVTYTSYDVLTFVLEGIENRNIKNSKELISYLNSNSTFTKTKLGNMRVTKNYFDFETKIKKYSPK